MRECGEYEITVEKFLKVVHKYTERIKIYVVTQSFDDGHREDRVSEYYLTDDFSKSTQEEERVLKYYADVPIWNIHVEFDNICSSSLAQPQKGAGVVAAIVGNCLYSDVREGRFREKEDLRKAKQREYKQNRKALRKGEN